MDYMHTHSTTFSVSRSRLPTVPGDIPLQTLSGEPVLSHQLWEKQPCLLFAIRRPGCLVCRHFASLLQQQKSVIEACGVRMIAVVKEKEGAQEFMEHYWKDPVLIDLGNELYKLFGNGDLNRTSLMGSMLDMNVWRKVQEASGAGFQGNFSGEYSILGGVLVISTSGEIVYQYTETFSGDNPPIQQVLDACAALVPETVGSTASLNQMLANAMSSVQEQTSQQGLDGGKGPQYLCIGEDCIQIS